MLPCFRCRMTAQWYRSHYCLRYTGSRIPPAVARFCRGNFRLFTLYPMRARYGTANKVGWTTMITRDGRNLETPSTQCPVVAELVRASLYNSRLDRERCDGSARGCLAPGRNSSLGPPESDEEHERHFQWYSTQLIELEQRGAGSVTPFTLMLNF
ncbi:hypothetical protein M011DRAFT_213220 [Sporormia fimetaria CBS 119925]|uniref:Uncharacterized protein n=1 Tax=Sporormia fimetaria CBS 119925 TaxID=1340428 RepID=A0A6A6UZV3_9PLEO|nr:hypothetical protein M011DRAFT_213220 [Sporormia fimetaria CBS 119925]